MKEKKIFQLYGYEDYKPVVLRAWALFKANIYYASNFYSEIRYYNDQTWLQLKDSQVKMSESQYYSYIESVELERHPEILETAKTVFIHPSCGISRTMVAQKYKKVLNPWLADAVVIPNSNKIHEGFSGLIFTNEDKKIVVVVTGVEKDLAEKLDLTMGNKLRDMMNQSTLQSLLSERPEVYYDLDATLDAKLEYYGIIGRFMNKNKYILEVLTNSLPKSKIVSEESVMATLGNEESAPTFDNLVSIKEMLDSSDSDTVAAGIKALSMLDYIHYPNSVRYILYQSCNYKYNKASDSTTAKYMFKYLINNTARGNVKFSDVYVSEKDYTLFHKLVSYYNNNEEQQYIGFLSRMPFMYQDENFGVHPRIKN